MSTLLSSPSKPEDICLQYSRSEQQSLFASFENGADASIETNSEKDTHPEVSSSGDNIPEIQHIEKDLVEASVSKEGSPFKQAVRGFVLNKLSKKVGSSHILSGFTEKLVKRLEEGKDGSAIEKSATIPQIKEPESPVEAVASDLLLETAIEAIEVFEETKSEGKLTHKVVSRSLPASPAHAFVRRASMDNSSDSEEKSSVSEPPLNALLLNDKEFLNDDTSISNNDIELIDINARTLIDSLKISKNLDFEGYPKNAYSGVKSDLEKPPEKYTFRDALLTLRKILASVSVQHWLLLISIFVHKYNILGCYLDYIFDASIIFYISFIVFTNMQATIHAAPLYPTYHNPQLETATIDLSKAEKSIRGSVKILKGDYDPEEQSVPPSETVSLLIEENCLQILPLPTKDQTEAQVLPHQVYQLTGAKVSLVPKGLHKKRLFSKKYPICITFPSSAKKVCSGSGVVDDVDSNGKKDSIPLVAHDDGLVEMPTQRALYFFALTSREKESWFQALTNAIRLCDSKKSNQQNSPVYKFDVSSMSFSSLLETNSDENLSLTEDGTETESEANALPPDSKLTLDFTEYMETIWENYQRVVREREDSEASERDPNSLTSSTLKNSTSVEWLNVALGRISYDFLTQKKWSEEVMVRIQKKLDKIDLPNFVGPLTVTQIFMGSAVPQLHAVSSPSADSFGTWFDFDFTYSGSFHMTLTTRLQIPRNQLSSTEESASSRLSLDASDTSEDESSGSKRSSPKHKLINKIERWVTHKHFQTVAQSRFVKKYVGDISNMPLTLTVEVNLLQGTLTLNIPPAPTDRLWYAFKKDPVLSLSATPKVGSREINLSGVIQMIEKKLKLAFKKAIVMPHMDDLVIPIMHTPAYNEES